MIKYNQVLYTVAIEGKGLLAVEELCSKRSQFTGYTDTVAEAVLYTDKTTAQQIAQDINDEENDSATVLSVYIRIE